MSAQAEPADFRVESRREGGGHHVFLHGVIDEHADLSFFQRLEGPVTVNLQGVRRINSFGVRSWIDAVRQSPSSQLVFVECSPPVVDQINMVSGFCGRGRVESFFAPMLCNRCSYEGEHLFKVKDVKANDGRLPDVGCPSCSAPDLEVDDLEEQYLLFTKD